MALKIKAELGGDGTGFERMMNKAGVTADRFGSHTMGHLKNIIAGAFSIGAIESLTRGTIEYAHHIRDLSDELGVNVEWLQEMQFVAKQSGASVDDLEKVIRKIATARAQALGPGGEKQLGAFAKFGVSAPEIQSGKITDIVDKIAKAFETGNQQELLPAFQALGGKGAAVMIPAFISGLAAGRAAAMAAGAVITEDVIDQLAEVEDAFQRLKMEVTAGLAPILVTVTQAIRGFVYILKELAAGIGGFFSNVDIGKMLHALNPFADNSVNMVDFFEEALKGWEMGKQTMQAQAEDDQKAEEARMKEVEQKRNERHKRENQSIEIGPLAPEKDKFKFARNSDALTSIGNFLGGSGAGADLVSVGERTNLLLTEGNRLLGNIDRKTGGATGGDGGISQE